MAAAACANATQSPGADKTDIPDDFDAAAVSVPRNDDASQTEWDTRAADL